MLIGREKELEWLNRQSRISPLLVISGIRGVGKTRLVREWLARNQKRFHWNTIERWGDLAHLLSPGESNLEAAFEKAPSHWKNVDVVIWDEAHLLSESARTRLLSLLRSVPFLPLQIFLSDEELTGLSTLDIEFAPLRLAPLSREETTRYLRELGDAAAPLTDAEAEQAWKCTGGLPLLLNLWLQGGETEGAFQKRVLEKLEPAERELLEVGACLGRPFKPMEGFAGSEPLTVLTRKLLVEEVPGAFRVVPGHIRALCLQDMDAEKRTLLERRVLKFLHAEGAEPNWLEILLHALRADEPAEISEAALRIEPERLEHLHAEDLRDLADLLAAKLLPAPGPTSVAELAETRLVRLAMRALFLHGNRKQSLSLGEAHAARLGERTSSEPRAYPLEQQRFFLELLQALNRSSQGEKARRFAERMSYAAAEPVSSLMRIELAASYLPDDPASAAALLRKLLEKLQRDRRAYPEAEASAVLAGAAFQLARSLSLLGDRDAADEYYSIAVEEFRRAERPYFATVALLNRAWIALNLRRWDRLAAIREQFGRLAAKLGYGYGLAGMDVIDASESALRLESGKALQKIATAIQRLGASAPLPARFDALAEKARILASLGLRTKASEALSELRDQVNEKVGGKPESSLRQRLDHLALEVEGFRLGTDGLLERLERIGEFAGDDWALILKLKRGALAPEAPACAALKSHPQGELALLESKLAKALLEERHEEAWQLLSRMERLLAATPDALAEKAVVALVQAELLTDAQEKARLLSRAELELLRWGSDPEARAPLEAWLAAARAGQRKSVADQSAWQKALPGDQARWMRLWKPFYRETKPAYLMITEQGRAETDELSTTIPEGRIYVIEHLAEAYRDRKRVKELVRRHSLRRLLSLLLESCPRHVEKSAIAGIVWGESYDARIHDARIYTAIQRLRVILRKRDCIQSWEGGYRWNPEVPFTLIRAQRGERSSENRCQGLILQAMDRFQKSGKRFVSRSELVEITQASEATVKRELAKLLNESRIRREGKGRSVVYSPLN